VRLGTELTTNTYTETFIHNKSSYTMEDSFRFSNIYLFLNLHEIPIWLFRWQLLWPQKWITRSASKQS